MRCVYAFLSLQISANRVRLMRNQAASSNPSSSAEPNSTQSWLAPVLIGSSWKCVDGECLELGWLFRAERKVFENRFLVVYALPPVLCPDSNRSSPAVLK